MLDLMPDGAVASPAAHGGSDPADAPARPRARRPSAPAGDEPEGRQGRPTEPGRKRSFSREAAVLPGWTLSRHLARTLTIATGFAALGGWLVVGAAWWMGLAVPLFWLVANVVEWTIHRYPMHRPMVPRVLYKNHAVVHHRAFDGADQEIRTTHELSLVMMPWYTLLFVFASTSPLVLAAWLVGGPPLAGVFLLSAVSYFLFYELVHTLHHLPKAVLRRSWWGRRRLLAGMRRHHHSHHQLGRMTEVNFNVTFAITDRLLGTYEEP
jgi:sterol desaturase/sphingolipid hydroxylase (fatty acid hydroxylase superfamily)